MVTVDGTPKDQPKSPQDQEGDSSSHHEEDDLTPPVPSYLLDDEDKSYQEERMKALKAVTDNVANTLLQWIKGFEVSRV